MCCRGETKGFDCLCSAAASLTVISVKAVSGMITESIKGQLQLIYPIFYIMLVIMIASCAFQIKSVNVFFGLAFFFKTSSVSPCCSTLSFNSLANLPMFLPSLFLGEPEVEKKDIQNCCVPVSVLHLHTFSNPRTFHFADTV